MKYESKINSMLNEKLLNFPIRDFFSLVNIMKYKINYKFTRIDNINLNESLFNNNQFLSEEIKIFILNNINYHYQLIKNNYNINIYSENQEEDDYLNSILDVIQYIQHIAKNSKNVEVYIYLTPFKKKFNKNIYNHENINTGSTNRQYIILWRREEIHKVLIHELIHFYNMDLNDDSIIAEKLLKKINMCPSCIIRPNEAYTELCAIILYTYWFCCINNKESYDNFVKCLNLQLKFNLIQCSKIIKSFECFDNLEDIFDNSKNCYIIQSTNMVSYYIIKTALLFNFNETYNVLFQEICNSSFIFYSNEDNYLNFYRLIIKSLKNKKFFNIINNLMEKNLNYFDNRLTMSIV